MASQGEYHTAEAVDVRSESPVATGLRAAHSGIEGFGIH